MSKINDKSNKQIQKVQRTRNRKVPKKSTPTHITKLQKIKDEILYKSYKNPTSTYISKDKENKC